MGSIDGMVPVDKADFVEFEKALTDKISMFSTSAHYPDFLTGLVKSLMLDQNAATCKKVKMDAEALHATKLKEEKAAAAKAKKGKPGKSGSLRMDTSRVRLFHLLIMGQFFSLTAARYRVNSQGHDNFGVVPRRKNYPHLLITAQNL